MSMTLQIILMWLVSIAAPVCTLCYTVYRFKHSDNHVISLFDLIQEELADCRKREIRLAQRVTDLEKQLRGM